MKRIIPIIFLAIFASLLYGLTIRGELGNPAEATIKASSEGATKPFELSPERGRFAHVMSLAEHGSYALSKPLAEFVYPDVGYYDGRFYSYFAPGISYMAEPFYELGKKYNLSQVTTFAFISLAAIGNILMLYAVSRRIFGLPIWASVMAPLIFAFSTTSWSYAITLYQHHLTLLFMLLGFYGAWSYGQGKKYSWVWGVVVWLCYGLAITIDYPNAVLLLPVMVYFLFSAFDVKSLPGKLHVGFRASLILTMIGFVVVTGLHLHHNQQHFGGWSKLAGGLVGYKDIVEFGLQEAADPEAEVIKLKGEKDVVKFFSEERFPNGFGTLFFSQDRGLFFYSPILILFLFGLYLALKSHRVESLVALSLIMVVVFLYSSWGDPWGGWAFGPRYLITAMGFMSIFIGFALSWSGRLAWLVKVSALPLLAYSTAVSLVGALTTNAVPPKIEADYLHTGFNYLYNYQFFASGQSGSFLFNSFASDQISLMAYALVIFGSLMSVYMLLMFVAPNHEPKD